MKTGVNQKHGLDRGAVASTQALAHSQATSRWSRSAAVSLMTGILLTLSVWRRIDLPTIPLIAVFSGAAAHALARQNKLSKWLAVPAWHDEDARTFRLEVDAVEFPEWLWRQGGGQGFIVRRINEEGPCGS
jgi:hypothetical protein